MSHALQAQGLLLCLPLFSEFAHIHVYWVSDATQPSHPLLPPSPFAFNLSHHQALFQWEFFSLRLFTSGGQSIGASASTWVLPVNVQGWFPLGLIPWSPRIPRDFQESSLAPQLESINSLAQLHFNKTKQNNKLEIKQSPNSSSRIYRYSTTWYSLKAPQELRPLPRWKMKGRCWSSWL